MMMKVMSCQHDTGISLQKTTFFPFKALTIFQGRDRPISGLTHSSILHSYAGQYLVRPMQKFYIRAQLTTQLTYILDYSIFIYKSQIFEKMKLWQLYYTSSIKIVIL